LGVTGAITATGKISSAATVSGDAATTVTTKNYVDNRFMPVIVNHGWSGTADSQQTTTAPGTSGDGRQWKGLLIRTNYNNSIGDGLYSYYIQSATVFNSAASVNFNRNGGTGAAGSNSSTWLKAVTLHWYLV
jgi:hypothetical protein